MPRLVPLLSGRDLPSRGKTLRCKLNCILSLSETRISATGLRKKMDGPIKSGHDGKRAENKEKSSWPSPDLIGGLTGPSILQQFHCKKFLPDSSGSSRAMTGKKRFPIGWSSPEDCVYIGSPSRMRRRRGNIDAIVGKYSGGAVVGLFRAQ